MVLLELEQGTQLSKLIDSLFTQGAELGLTIIKALLVFIIGRLLISLVNKLVTRILIKRDIDPSVKTFVGSLVNVVLMITTSFAALLASAGVAVGMALSGNLSNFAGGLIILLFRPYKVGDFIDSQGVQGTVKAIQIFHTVLITGDNKVIYIPNGSLSGGVVTNYSNQEHRRVDLTIDVEYNTDFQRVKQVLEDIIAHDARIQQQTPAAPQIYLSQLAESSVKISIRMWVKSADYWAVFFNMNQTIYERFNKEGIGFPFPQLTVHQAKE